MLAQGIEGDVSLDNHVVGIDCECFGKMRRGVLIHATRELGVHARHTCRGLDEPLAIRVLADTLKQQANRSLHLFLIDHGSSRTNAYHARYRTM